MICRYPDTYNDIPMFWKPEQRALIDVEGEELPGKRTFVCMIVVSGTTLAADHLAYGICERAHAKY